MSVCFHNQTRCVYCWPPSGLPSATRRHRLRCVTCGRWRKHTDVERCSPCVGRGFEALRLWAVAA